MDVTMIHNWRDGWKFLSTQSNAIGIALATEYMMEYDRLKEMLPPKAMVALVIAMFAVNIFLRFVKQETLTKEVDDGTPKS